jgi:hypothetical protein
VNSFKGKNDQNYSVPSISFLNETLLYRKIFFFETEKKNEQQGEN